MRGVLVNEAARAIMAVVENAPADFLKEEIVKGEWKGFTVDEILTHALNDLLDIADMAY